MDYDDRGVHRPSWDYHNHRPGPADQPQDCQGTSPWQSSTRLVPGIGTEGELARFSLASQLHRRAHHGVVHVDIRLGHADIPVACDSSKDAHPDAFAGK